MRDFKEFLSGELVVQFKSAEELVQFLKLCESKGITWFGGFKAPSYVPDWETEGIRFDHRYRCIWRGALYYYRDAGYTIIPAKVFMSRDFQEFKDGKVAVSVAGDTEDEFLKLCERSGLLWSNGEPPTAITVDDGDFCFIRHTTRGLQRGGKIYYNDVINVAVADYTEFSYEQDLTVPEVVKDEVVPPIYGYYRVEIVRKGRKVVCREYLNGSVINEGTACCHPDDEFDFKFGSDLAYDRMRGREVKREVKPVKTKVVPQKTYEVGDVVMMDEPKECYCSDANSFMGKEQVISSVDCDGFYRIEGSTYAWHGYRDIAGKVVPVKTKIKIVKQDRYEVGDTVMMVTPKSGYNSRANSFLGKEQVISSVFEGNRYEIVDTDTFIWSPRDIKGKVIHVPVEPKFVKKDVYEVGDVVRIKKKWKSGFQNDDGEMDEYLGTNLTISEVHPYGNKSYSAKEDGGRWEWFHEDIKGAVL